MQIEELIHDLLSYWLFWILLERY